MTVGPFLEAVGLSPVLVVVVVVVPVPLGPRLPELLWISSNAVLTTSLPTTAPLCSGSLGASRSTSGSSLITTILV